MLLKSLVLNLSLAIDEQLMSTIPAQGFVICNSFEHTWGVKRFRANSRPELTKVVSKIHLCVEPIKLHFTGCKLFHHFVHCVGRLLPDILEQTTTWASLF